MKYLCFFLFLFSSFGEAREDIKSCITYSFSEIKTDTAEFILRNIFNEHLYSDLRKKFPEENIEWDNWVKESGRFIDEDGTSKTFLKGCFVVNDIYKRPSLVKDIMIVADSRAKAALKFYSRPKGHKSIDSMISDSMYQQMEKQLDSPEMQKELDSYRSGEAK